MQERKRKITFHCVFFLLIVMRRCLHGAECKWLAQWRCLFLHTEQEQRDVLSIEMRMKALFGGWKRPGRRLICSVTRIIHLAASMMWERPLQQSQSLFLKLGLLGLQRTVLQQSQYAQCLPVKLDFFFFESRAGGMNKAGATEVVTSVGEARPPGFVECSGTAESESRLAGSPGGRGGAAMEFLVQSKWHDQCLPFSKRCRWSLLVCDVLCHDRVRARSFFR